MSSVKTKAEIWTLGLEPEQCGLIERAVGPDYQCRNLSQTLGGQSRAEILAGLEQPGATLPELFWIGGQSWLQIREEHPALFLALHSLPTVLVLERDPSRKLLEAALDAPSLQVLRAPFGQAQIFDVLSRVLEVRNLYGDLNRMSREIALERELLERKSEVCSLLFRFFAKLSENSSACNLAAGAQQVLAEYCDLEALHLAWWGNTDQITYVLGLDAQAPNAEAWRDFMAEQALRLHPNARSFNTLHWPGGNSAPKNGEGLLLPLEIRGRSCGVLALQLARPLLPSRDMAQALDVVRKQLALALWEGSSCPDYFSAQIAPRRAAQPGSSWQARQ